nr:unnamed protein product [Digitaria exilis]
MAPPASPITFRPSAARRPLLLRAPAPRVGVTALARCGLPRRDPLPAAAWAHAHARGIGAARPWLGTPTRREDEAAPARETTRCAAAGQVAGSTSVGRGAGLEVPLAAAAVVAMATGNRVLYKLALVPLRQYPFFLAQFATFGCTYLVWQLLLSAIFLKRRYRINEITGCLLVAIGVIITVATGSGTGASLKSTGIVWQLLMIISFFFQAADTVLKEIIFRDASKKLKCGSVDLFVVNSYGSAYQALFMCLLLPFLSKLWGVPFHLLPTYIKDGAACFLNMGSISVPLAIYAFTLPLPYIGAPSTLPPGFVADGASLGIER